MKLGAPGRERCREKAQEEAQKQLLAERDRIVMEAKASAGENARLELAGRDGTR